MALDAGLPVPRPLHELEKHVCRLGSVEVLYPGAGQAIDNVVAWVPQDGVLFGGCLVKPTTAPDLGNMADGDARIRAALALQGGDPRGVSRGGHFLGAWPMKTTAADQLSY